MSSEENLTENKIVFYSSNEGKVTVDVYFANENFWLTQKAMGELFGINAFNQPGVEEGKIRAKQILQDM